MPDYRDLLAWQEADRLAHAIYDETATWPREERYALTAQARRAALSIPANIAEGAVRRGPREFAHFLSVAMGSHAETHYLVGFARARGFSSSESFPVTSPLLDRTGRLLWGLYRSVRAGRTR